MISILLTLANEKGTPKGVPFSPTEMERSLAAAKPAGADEGSAPEGLTGKKKGEAFRLDVRPLFYYELLYFYTASSRTQEFLNLSNSKTTIETLLAV